ncbi:hypothetical protein [Nocardioides sp. Kera G14]|uniref:hypothetical protein n=1 Tax=Nocardioides sp. Kera G14 TaxID=2884264 RepID=UPI001D1199A8|nr:hypothetical protein [Nocardioides sp. Kera G14]UDY23571.1 hypothetical protein LH076_16130 [Nocardioides sp. Kera G14]
MPRALQRALTLPGLLLITLLVALPIPSATAVVDTHRAEATTPLTVAITSLTPGAIPKNGPIRVSGTVTNTDTVTWLDVGISPFVSSTPMTTSDELTAALAQPADAEVGSRILTDVVTIPTILPGQSVSYTLTVKRSDLEAEGVGAPGVYWFGVHALGTGPDGRDGVADGRARTFLPLLAKSATPISATVIVPVRATVTRNGEGALADVDRWSDLLEPDGRLGRILTLARGPAGHDVSWLVDPAVLAAVQQLAAGNPPRPLAPAPAEDASDDDQGDGSSPDASPSPSPEDPDADDGDTPDEATQKAAALAADWWAGMSHALQGADVLALPYGDLDLTGAALHDTSVYKTARTRGDEVFKAWGLTTTPVNAPIAGALDADTAGLLRTADATTPVLVTNSMLPAEGDPSATAMADPTLVRSADLDLVPVSSDVSTGGPGPDDRLAGTALRQRILAEAALRSLSATGEPVVVQLPTRWEGVDAEQLALGLRQPWLSPRSLSSTVTSAPVTAIDFDHLQVPDTNDRQVLSGATFAASGDLIRFGRTLQHVLTGNTAVADATLDEALADLSYQRRGAPTGGASGSVFAIQALLGRIRVQAPRAVTLSGSSGRFAATVTNDLTQPVTVTLQPLTDEGLTITTPKAVEIAGGASATVLMQATHARVGVHSARLVLTDKDGVHLGTGVEVPVRAAQVSKIIWLFLAVGCGLLFGAIIARLIRRVRHARRGEGEEGSPA